MIKEKDLFYGIDQVIDNTITIRIPKIGEILEYGITEYCCLVSKLCQTLQEIKDTYDRLNIKNDDITEYILFRDGIRETCSFEETKILFGDFDLSKADIDERTHFEIVKCIRQMHGYDGIKGKDYFNFISIISKYGKLYKNFPVSTFTKLIKKGIIPTELTI